MALEQCACGVRFAVGLFRCPRCQTVAPRYASRAAVGVVRADPLAPVAELPFKQLRASAKARGLSGAGTAAELAARIAEHDRADTANGGDGS